MPTNPEFEFFTWVGGSFTNASATLTIPGGGVVNYPFLAGDQEFDWFDGVGSPYASKAALDAAYPNGSYVVHVLDSGLDETVTLNLTGDNYPVTPHVSNFDDLQSVNPTLDLTISWSSFSNPSVGNSFIELAVEDAVDDDIMYFSQSIIPASTQSLVVPANTLPADTAMSVYLRFYTFAHIPAFDQGAIFESSVDAPLVTVTDSLAGHVFEIEVISGYEASGLDAAETFADIEVDSDKSFNAVTVLQPGGGTLNLVEQDFGEPDRVRWEYEGDTLLADGDYVFTFTSASGNSQTTISYLRANATPLTMPDLQPVIGGVNSAGFIEGTPSTAISWNSPSSDPKISGIFIDGEPRVWDYSDPLARVEIERSPSEDDAASNSFFSVLGMPAGVFDLELVFHDGHDGSNADGISYWVSRERIHEATLLVADPTGPASSLLSEIEMWFEWSATEHYVDISVTGDLSLTRVKVRTPNEFDFELTNNGSGQWNLRHTGVAPSVFDNFGDGIYTFLLEYPDAPQAVQQAMTHLVYLNSDFSPLILPTVAANFTAPAAGSSNDSPVAISWSVWSPGDPAFSEPGAGIALEVSNNSTDDEFDLAKSASSESVTLDPGSYNATLFFDNGGPDDANGDGIGLSYGKASRDDLSFSVAGDPGTLTWLDYDDFSSGNVDGSRWDVLGDAATVAGQEAQLSGDGTFHGTDLELLPFEENMSVYGLRAQLSISSASSNDTAIQLTSQIGGGLAAIARLQRDAGGAVGIVFSVKNDLDQTLWTESSATPATADSLYDLALVVQDSSVEFFEDGVLVATYTGTPLQSAQNFAIRAISTGNSYATAASQVKVVRRPYILVVSKARFYEQNGVAAPTVPSGHEFLVDLRGYIPNASATFTAPSKAPQTVAFNAGRFEEFFQEFAGQAELDAAYPNGDYLVSITGDFSADVDIDLTGDNYPAPVPAFTNFAAMQDVDPNQDFEVTWSSFGNAQQNILIEVAVETPEEDIVFQASLQPSSTTSMTIPVGTLAPDTAYLVFVRFYTWVDVVASSWGGTYEATTDSTLVTNSGSGGGPTGAVFLEDFDAVATGFGISQAGDDGETITVYENPNAGTPANSTGGRASWGDNSAPDAEVVEENPGKFLRLHSDMPGATASPSFFGILDFPGFGQGASGGPFVGLDGDDVLGSTVSFQIRLPAAIDYPFYARVLFADSTQLSPAREDDNEEFVTQPLLISSASPGVWQTISFVDLQASDFSSLDGTGHTFSGQSNLFALEFLAEDGPGGQDFFDLDDVSLTFAAGDRAWEPYDDFVSGGFDGGRWSIQTEQSSTNPQVVGEQAVFNTSLNDGFSKIEILDGTVFGVQADATLVSADNDTGIEIEFYLSDGSSGWLDLHRGDTGQLGISGEVVDTLDNTLWQAPQWSGATDLGIVYSLAVIVEDNRVKFYVDGELLGESQAFVGVGIDYFRLGVWGDANGASISGTLDNVEVLRADGSFTGSISAPQPTVSEEGGTGSFQISIGSPAPAGGVDVVINVSGSAQQGQDYHLKVNGAELPDTSSVSITVPQGASSVNVIVEPVDDANPEIEETVVLDLMSVDGDAASGQATVTIDHSDIAYFVLWVNRATVNGDAGVGESGQLNWWMVAPIGKSLVSATFTMANGESYQADIEDGGERADLEVETVFGRDGASLADLEAKMQSGTYTALLTYSDSSTETRQGNFTWGAWPAYPVVSSPTHYANGIDANNRVTVEWTGGEGWVSLEQTNGPFANARVDYFESEWLPTTGNHSYEIPVSLLPNQDYEIDVLGMSGDMGSISVLGFSTGTLPTFTGASSVLAGSPIGEWPDGSTTMTKRHPNGSEESFTRVISRENVTLPGFTTGAFSAVRWTDTFADGSVHDRWLAKADSGSVYSVREACGASVGTRTECGGTVPILLAEAGASVGSKWYSGDSEEPVELVSTTATAPNAGVEDCVYLRIVWEGEGSEHWWYKPGLGLVENHDTYGVDTTICFGAPVVNQAATPEISPDGGTHIGSVQVTLSSATNGAELYYTTDGSQPSDASMLYAGPFALTDSKTVTAIAYATAHDPSETASATFTVNPVTLAAVFDLAAIDEDDGPGAATLTLSRDGDLSQALTINLASDDPTELSVPPTAIIAAGQSSGSVSVDAEDDLELDLDATVTVTASATDHVSATANITVQNVDRQLALAHATDHTDAAPYRDGDTIALSANLPAGLLFSHWSSSPGGTFANPNALDSDFTMPDADTRVIAVADLDMTFYDRFDTDTLAPPQWAIQPGLHASINFDAGTARLSGTHSSISMELGQAPDATLGVRLQLQLDSSSTPDSAVSLIADLGAGHSAIAELSNPASGPALAFILRDQNGSDTLLNTIPATLDTFFAVSITVLPGQVEFEVDGVVQASLLTDAPQIPAGGFVPEAFSIEASNDSTVYSARIDDVMVLTAVVPTYTLNVTNGSDLSDQAPYPEGVVVQVSATIPAGMQFDGWSASAGSFADRFAAITEFTIPASDAGITAQFSPATPDSPPFLIQAIPDQVATEDLDFSLDLSVYFHEPNSDAMTYALAGSPSGLQVDPASGLITGAPTDADGNTADFTVAVTVSDPQNNRIARSFHIHVISVNHAPDPDDATATLLEDAAPGALLHTVLPNDPDGADSHTFSIVGGTAASALELTPTGEIRLARANVLDFENAPELTLIFSVTDGSLSGSATLTLTVNDANDKPTGLSLAATTILDTFPGVVVGEITVIDQDVQPQFRNHSIELSNAPRFEIVDGMLKLKPGERVLAQAESEVSVSIRVREGLGVPIIRRFTLSVIGISTQTFELALHSPVGADIGGMTQLVAEGATDPVYQISAPANAPFAIDAATGRLRTSGLCPLDNLGDTVELLIQLVESGDGTVLDSGVAKINIVESEFVPEIRDQAFTLDLAASDNTVVGRVAAFDANGDSLTFAITAGNSAGVFALDAAGELSLADANALDFATTSEYLLTVSAADGQTSADATVSVRSEAQLDVLVVYADTPVERSVATSENVFFVTRTAAEGRELWGHDGDSLSLLADILPGAGSGIPNGGRLALHNGIVYLPASNGSEGLELWRSDGTPGGTEIVSDLAAGAADSSPIPLASGPDGLLFVTETAAESGSGPADCETTQIIRSRKLWVTDGTAPGSVIRADIPDSVSISNCLSSIANVQLLSELLIGSSTFYSVDTQLSTSFADPIAATQLWQLGATPADNALLFTADDSSIDGLQRIGDSIALTIDGELRIHHASSGITHSVRAGISDVAAFHGAFYSLSAGTNSGLYRSTPASLCSELVIPLPDASMSAIALRNDRLYFQTGDDVWSSDGTASGSIIIHSFLAGGTATNWIAVNGRVYFIWEGDSGSELWQTDGSATGTMAVPMIADSETLAPLSLSAGGNDLYVIADTATIDRGLFRLPAATPAPAEITGQTPLVSSGDGSISINVDDLLLSNVDPVARASGIQIELIDGDNYSISNGDIVPDPGFSGTLRVPVRLFINDVFKDEFVLTVQVVAQIDGSLNFDESTTSRTEFDGVHQVGIKLELGTDQETIDEVTVTVVDQGSGTASAGTDYALLADSVVFPAGSRDGRVAYLPLQIFANDTGESTFETINLALTTITGTGNLGVGSTGQTVITIEDALQTTVSAAVVYAGDQQGDLRVQVSDEEQVLQDFLGSNAIDLLPLPEGDYQLRVFVDSDNDLRAGRTEATVTYLLSISDLGGVEEIGSLTLTDPSLDADDLPDYWELLHFGDLAQKNDDDPDNDQIPNRLEFQHGLDPLQDDPPPTRPEFPLTLSVSGDGTTSPAAGAGTYTLGETVTLSATPGGLSTFIGWSGSLTETTSPQSLVILGDSAVTAHFAVDPNLHLPVFELTPDLIVLNIGDADPDLTAGVTLTDEHQADAIGELTFGGNTAIDTSAPGEFLVTYSWFDDILGAARELSRLYVVVDQTAPVLTISPAELEIEAGDSMPDFTDGVSALDNVDGDLDDDIQPSGNLDPDRVGEYTINYQVSDQSGNVASGTRVYRVADTVAPTLTVTPAIIDLGLGESIDFLDGVSATDIVDGDIRERVRFSGAPDTPGMGEFTVTYRVSDVAGNPSDETRLYRIGCSAVSGALVLDLDDPTAFVELTLPNGDILAAEDLSAGFSQRVAEFAFTLGAANAQALTKSAANVDLADDERYVIAGEDLDISISAAGRTESVSIQVSAACADIHVQRFNLLAALAYDGPQTGAYRAILNGGDGPFLLAVTNLGILEHGDLKPGPYTVDAFVDANNNGSRDFWEATASVPTELQADAFLGLLELIDPDTDSDELPDWWEVAFFGNLDRGPNDDPDFDRVSNRLELAGGTHPNDAANPDPAPTFTLTVTIAGDGSGSTSLAAGSHSFDYGATVDVTAIASGGDFFAGWTGGFLGLGTANLRITKDVEIVATFSSQPAYYIPLRKGWNLIGSPVDSAQTVGEIFVNDQLLKTRIGGVFAWDGSDLVAVADDETLRANQGYWVHVPRRGSITQLITGRLGPATLELSSGWNLISVPERTQLPAIPGIQAILTYDGKRHRDLAPGAFLELLHGYWIRTDRPLSVPLAP